MLLTPLQIFTLFASFVVVISNPVSPIVCLKNGCVRGKVMPGYQRENFEAFLGIPFAQPPVGPLRFQNPVPAEPWPGTLDGRTEKNMCIQKNYLIPNPPLMGDEDCLYLYVYRPAKISTEDTPLPVMVYIHGGGFFAGSGGPSLVGPEYFMDTGKVILVSIQYRLSVLGFLSTGDTNASGNFGLKDQAMALKWIKQNIEYFGGDSNRITVFGQSAGAASTHMHMISPLSRHYFDRAIVMSGNALAAYSEPNPDPLGLARKHAQAVGIEGADKMTTARLAEALREVDIEELVDATAQLKFWSVDPLVLYGPVVEHFSVDNGFFYETPQQMWREGNFKQMPWMTGTVSNDGAVRALAIIANDTLLTDLNKNLDTLFPKLFELRGGSWSVSEKLRKIKKRYFNGKSRLSKSDGQRFTDLFSDLAFIHPLYKSVKQYVAKADFVTHPVSLYKFEFKGPLSYSALYTGSYKDYGVVHCDELIYLFRSPAIFPIDFDKKSTEAEMIRVLTNYFADFAANGTPPHNENKKMCKCAPPCAAMPKCDYHRFVRRNGTAGDNVDIVVDNEVDQQMLLFWNSLEN